MLILSVVVSAGVLPDILKVILIFSADITPLITPWQTAEKSHWMTQASHLPTSQIYAMSIIRMQQYIQWKGPTMGDMSDNSDEEGLGMGASCHSGVSFTNNYYFLAL